MGIEYKKLSREYAQRPASPSELSKLQKTWRRRDEKRKRDELMLNLKRGWRRVKMTLPSHPAYPQGTDTARLRSSGELGAQRRMPEAPRR
jgi:hypothetical protein